MVRKRKSWTEDEDLVVISFMKAHQEDKGLACKLAAEALDRTPTSVADRWYKRLRPRKRSILGGKCRCVNLFRRLLRFIFRR